MEAGEAMMDTPLRQRLAAWELAAEYLANNRSLHPLPHSAFSEGATIVESDALDRLTGLLFDPSRTDVVELYSVLGTTWPYGLRKEDDKDV